MMRIKLKLTSKVLIKIKRNRGILKNLNRHITERDQFFKVKNKSFGKRTRKL